MRFQIRYYIILIIILLVFPLSVVSNLSAESWDENWHLKHLLRLAAKPPREIYPSEKIYRDNGIIYCTGTGNLAGENNRAAELMKKGEYREAINVLNSALKHSALFFPYRYNLGVCYLHLDELKKSHLNFTKAQQVVPEYSKTYLELGYIYERWNRDSDAVETFRKALRRNSKEISSFILIGDIFFKRGQYEMARKYYDASLTIYHKYPNGLLGRAKIYFKRGKYLKSLNLLKSISTRGEYDKSLHYYYAEASFKLQDYKTASRQYSKLLEFRNDRFFLTNSPVLIKYKLNLSNRFIGQ